MLIGERLADFLWLKRQAHFPHGFNVKGINAAVR